MGFFRNISNWLTGDSTPYKTIIHCLSGDWPWISLIVCADAIIWVGYMVIAYNWRKQRIDATKSDPGPSGMHGVDALSSMQAIFALCGVTYIWSAIDLVWPAWRLLAFAKLILLVATWRYVFQVGHLSVVYQNLSQIKPLEQENKSLSEQVKLLRKAVIDLRKEGAQWSQSTDSWPRDGLL